MILFTILLLTLTILTVATVLTVGTLGAGAIIIFGDVIVCGIFIVWIMKRLIQKKKK